MRRLGKSQYDETALLQLLRATGLVIFVFAVGTLGFYVAQPPPGDLLKAAYMTVITLTTVGFHEVIPVTGDPGLQVFTTAIIVAGIGTTLYFFSTLTAFIVEGGLRDLLRYRRMRQTIDELEEHFIVAGIGNTGEYVLREMLDSQRDCVVIDDNKERVTELVESDDIAEFPFIIGDATSDEILEMAGIDRAMGLVVSLGNDRDNLFVTITAKSLNPDLRVVARGQHPEAEQKFKMAGATSVIYTNVLGGLRMASEVIRPEVTTFLDLMMKDHGHYRRVEELEIPEDSPLIGQQIQETGIRQFSDALIIAVYHCEDDEYTFNPGPDHLITSDTKLILLTLIEDIESLEALVSGERQVESNS